MARPKKAPTEAADKASSVVSEERRGGTLKSMLHTLSAAGFDQRVALRPSEAGMSAAIVWGRHEGVETPRVLTLVLPSGAWDRSNADSVQMLSYTGTPVSASIASTSGAPFRLVHRMTPASGFAAATARSIADSCAAVVCA